MAAVRKKITGRKSVKSKAKEKKAPAKTSALKKTTKKIAPKMEPSRKATRQPSQKIEPEKKKKNPVLSARKPQVQKILTAEGWKRLLTSSSKR